MFCLGRLDNHLKAVYVKTDWISSEGSEYNNAMTTTLATGLVVLWVAHWINSSSTVMTPTTVPCYFMSEDCHIFYPECAPYMCMIVLYGLYMYILRVYSMYVDIFTTKCTFTWLCVNSMHSHTAYGVMLRLKVSMCFIVYWLILCLLWYCITHIALCLQCTVQTKSLSTSLFPD